MARYGANELFNPGGGRRKKKKEGVTTGSGPSLGSLGSMPHSQAPDALALLTSALSLGEDIKKMTTENGTTTPSEKKEFSKVDKGEVQKNKLGQKYGGGASQGWAGGKKKKRISSFY